MTAHGSFLRPIAAFARDRRAVGAVEFAMVAPFLLVLYLGGSQISMGLTMNRKVQHVASTINDLVTQSDKLKAEDIKGIFNLAKSIMVPYDLKPLGIKVTSVKIDDKGKQTVDWDYAGDNMTKLGKGATFPLPSQFSGLRNTYMIVTQTKYEYKPIAVAYATGPLSMGGKSYLNPRNGDKVDCSDC